MVVVNHQVHPGVAAQVGQEYEEWSRRDLSNEEHVYIWADGIHVNVRLEDDGNQKQCCWVHKTANVLSKIPKALQAKAKSDLHQIWLAETRDAATKAFDHFLEKYEAACNCLSKDWDVLLAFYDFPAEHWGHVRTTNPIESTFSTIRLRHRRTKGSGSRRASLTMMFKLAQSASQPPLATTQRPSPDHSCSRRENLHRRSPAERRLIQIPRTQLLTITPRESARRTRSDQPASDPCSSCSGLC